MADTRNYTLQLRRNSGSYGSKQSALDGLKIFLNNKAQLGEPAIASYNSVEENGVLIGVKGTNTGTIQIFEGAQIKADGSLYIPVEVEKAIKAVQGDTVSTIKNVEDGLAALKSGSTKTIKDLEDTINAMDFETPTGSVITSVSQTDGKITATGANITSNGGTVKVDGLDLDVNIDNETIIKDNNNKLKVASSAVTISGKEAIKVSTGISGNEVSLVIPSSEKVLSQNEGGLVTTISIVKNSATPSEENVLDEYRLIGKNNVQLGDTIKIYKDQALTNVELVDQKLRFTYTLENGTVKVLDVDVSKFLTESEFTNGLQVIDGVVSVKKASGSEAYLVVDGNGVAISGVTSAINKAITDIKGGAGTDGDTLKKLDDKINTEATTARAAEKKNADDISDLKTKMGSESVSSQITNAINDLDADVSGKTADGHVSVRVEEANGKLTKVTVLSEDIASAAKLQEVSNLVGNTSVQAQITNSLNVLSTTTSVTSSDSHVKVGLTQTNGKISEVTLEGIDIASNGALTNEINQRKAIEGQNGTSYTPNSTANYIGAATSLNDADIKLDAAIKSVSDLIGTSGSVAGQITNAIDNLNFTDTPNAEKYVSSVSEVKGLITVGRTPLKASDSDNMLEVKGGGLYLSSTLDGGTY